MVPSVSHKSKIPLSLPPLDQHNLFLLLHSAPNITPTPSTATAATATATQQQQQHLPYRGLSPRSPSVAAPFDGANFTNNYNLSPSPTPTPPSILLSSFDTTTTTTTTTTSTTNNNNNDGFFTYDFDDIDKHQNAGTYLPLSPALSSPASCTFLSSPCSSTPLDGPFPLDPLDALTALLSDDCYGQVHQPRQPSTTATASLFGSPPPPTFASSPVESEGFAVGSESALNGLEWIGGQGDNQALPTDLFNLSSLFTTTTTAGAATNSSTPSSILEDILKDSSSNSNNNSNNSNSNNALEEILKGLGSGSGSSSSLEFNGTATAFLPVSQTTQTTLVNAQTLMNGSQMASPAWNFDFSFVAPSFSTVPSTSSVPSSSVPARPIAKPSKAVKSPTSPKPATTTGGTSNDSLLLSSLSTRVHPTTPAASSIPTISSVPRLTQLSNSKSMFEDPFQCRSCSKSMGTMVLRGPPTSLPPSADSIERTFMVDVLCATCSELEKHGGVGHELDGVLGVVVVPSRKRAKGRAEKKVACDVCRASLGTGGVKIPTCSASSSSSNKKIRLDPSNSSSNAVNSSIPAEDWADESQSAFPFSVEVVCAPCRSHYAFCTDCGGGGKHRTGKYRPIQYFKQGRRTCQLSHVRVPNEGVEVSIHTDSDPAAGVCEAEVKRVLEDGFGSFFGTPKFLAQAEGAGVETLARVCESTWSAYLDPFFRRRGDVTMMGERECVVLAKVGLRPRKKSKTAAATCAVEKSTVAFLKVRLFEGGTLEIQAGSGLMWAPQSAGLFRSMVLEAKAWAGGEGVQVKLADGLGEGKEGEFWEKVLS
ncbi:hypothetical protein HDV05_002473 [Chytridiales sp. JEL 0842]|nr:hypothetical protein HDV05_002473 [Chytridiales sp. JEL 0842]